MNKLHIHVTVAVSLSALISPVFADKLQAPPFTLDKALKAAPADNEVTIAAQADAFSLSASQHIPSKNESTTDIVHDFGLSTRTYGSVRAVAPATMYRYNASPEDPDPFDGMTPQEIIKGFAATLDDSQWRLFTDQHGIGLLDLKSGLQRALFLAMFPGHEIHASPDKPLTEDGIRKRLAAGTTAASSDTMDLTPQLNSARLRLGLRTEVSLAGSDAARSSQPARLAVPGAPQYFVLAPPSSFAPADRLFGIKFREFVASEPKPGDLDGSLPALQRKLVIDKDKTVGDLVNHVSEATGLEIVATHALEGLPLTIAGGNASVTAADLLNAIAYSTAGTYRRVGTAYVLTGDLTGKNVLRQRWVEAEETVNRLRRDLAQPQAVQGAETRRFEDLSVLPGALTPTDTQRNAWLHPSADHAAVSFKDLTPGEQQTVKTQLETRKMFQDVLKAQHPELATTLTAPPTITPETQVDVAVHIDLEADIPTLAGPVAFDLEPHLDDILTTQSNPAPAAGTPAKVMLGDKLPKGAGAADLPTIIRRFSRRAVQAEPQTVAEVDAIIASMKKLGLNELWLDVFSDGKTRAAIPGDAHPDILGEALRIGPKAGIRVLPVLDLYLWNDDAPAPARDLNIYGEDSAEAYAHQMRVYDDPGAEVENGDTPRKPKPGEVFANPFNPATQTRLGQLLRSLAAQPGIDGMVWRESEPRGYRVSDGSDAAILDLGYTSEMRLAFLRKSHVDPIDILPDSYAKVDQFLRTSQDDPGAAETETAWRSMLGDAKLVQLKALDAAAQQAAGNHHLAIILRQAGYSDGGTGWYGTWDDPAKPVPTYRSPNRYIAELSTQPPPGPWVVQAKAQSKTALYLVPPGASREAGKLAADLTAHVQGKPWDGFVLDLRRDSIAYQDTADYPADPVAALMTGK